MDSSTMDTPKQPLGVGGLIGQSFSIFFQNFIKVMLVGFIPTLLGLMISGTFNGMGVTLGLQEPEFATTAAGIGYAVSLLINMVVYGLLTALLVQLAYDAKLGRSISIGRYFGPALRAAVPIAVLAVVAGFATGLGLIFLVVPGLWVYAVYYVMAPAVVIEKAGFGGLGRSAALTKGYRWPLVLLFIVMGIVTVLINVGALFGVGMLIGGLGDSTVGYGIGAVAYALATALAYGIGGISVALAYARLREIKEGVSVDQIAAVFD